MTIEPATTLRNLAFIVSTMLEQAGISAVLSGGGAATVYAPEVNQSRDLDFILTFWSSLDVSEKPILDLGFERQGGSYVHPATEFTLEFPAGPLRIGDEVITTWSVLREGEMVLQILSPTDCVRDRLSWFLFYERVDYSALEQALAVAMRHRIDFEGVREWAQQEGVAERFKVFESRLKNRTH